MVRRWCGGVVTWVAGRRADYEELSTHTDTGVSVTIE